jgi:hypothetical protein
MKVIIYINDMGKVSVCTPTGELPIEEVKAKHTPAHSIIIEDTNLPSKDFDFHDAWEIQNGGITINISKARDFTKGRLRFQRQVLLEAQDVLFQRALESGADTTSIVKEKNRLRDLPSLADTCTTLEELRALKV